MRAIGAVGSVLQEYDSDKNIPVFGFGAQIQNMSKALHCFALNGNMFAPEVHGIDGILATYQHGMPKLNFSGPTNFAEIIRYVGDMAYWHVSNNLAYNYFVLLIITDGQISDMQDTIDEIVRCSTLPVSIVIVGVGSADFSEMDRLDADTQPLYSPKLVRYAARDIVQFVPFRKYAKDPQELARCTLGELPKQMVDYMAAMKIPPVPQSTLLLPPADVPSFYQARQQEFARRAAPVAPPEAVSLQR